ncbi:MAG: PRC-barrel domain-containing protein, partial [Gemmatimonadetes bacterium]|nr:PRC-barrel domain-containing protein [Gemmatimonadota bacterium]
MDERMAERRDLTSLNESDDLEVARGEPDPRGWSVVASDGRTIGKVDDLLVDTAAMKVRFLDCDVDEASLGLDPADRHLLIPVGRATLRERDREVYVEGFDTLRLARLHGRGDLSALDARESAAPTTPA